MNERAILEQRVITLNGLLDTPGGPLGNKAGILGRQFGQRWTAERQLLRRILDETPADATDADTRATLTLWRDRTAAFVRSSDSDQPTWTDRNGLVWDAHVVLSLLDDIQERIEAWKAPPVQADVDDVPPVGPTAVR